jgi:hypothetical protein
MPAAVVRGKQAIDLGVGRDTGEDQADPKNEPERVSHVPLEARSLKLKIESLKLTAWF